MKKVFIIAVISLIISFISPFLFKQYIEKKPLDQKNTLVFGGPIPFAEQKVALPQDDYQYPAVIRFQSPLKQETIFHPIPLLFTFICIFVFLFAVSTIVASYFTKIPKKKKRKIE
ncbi:hypothetical protein [Niallia sp. 03133]|uniref:hypothetical protein n=1 Tax=Niallia sp. 03133 TaxID=3458060 RepID=UPI00404480A0